ncbi:MAG: NADP-specific glutamate dehydrogenase [Elusimicrobiota bacterium]
MSDNISRIFEQLVQKNSGEPEFHQAVKEVLETISPVLEKHPEFKRFKIVERLVEPDRAIMFRVPWVDHKGEVQINKGYRVQFNNAIGPYKGGLRFHPSLNLGIIKFLAFEQIFKNALTTLPMGGGKGGSDFDPKGKTDIDVMNFCQSFMRELFKHIGEDIDVPAGDIGVGAREIGYLYGYYKRVVIEHTGVLTGKGMEWGGSFIRPEATGYGLIYFVNEMLKTKKMDFKDKTVAISGAGNVAQYAAEKAIQLGARVITMCDTGSTILDEEGMSMEKLEHIKEIKNINRARIKEYTEKYPATCIPGKSVWDAVKDEGFKVDIALPCATQNEIDKEHAEALVQNGCFCVAEGANMPTNSSAIKVFKENNVMYGPGKAANAGGVAVSGLEMAQNRQFQQWSREAVDKKLKAIMKSIHSCALNAAKEYKKPGDYEAGSNIAGFLKVARAMVAQGVV